MSGRRPQLLQGRIPCGEEEFLSWHFPTGERRDAARFLWRLLERQMGLDLRGLHPDVDLNSILLGGGFESLDSVELAMALEEIVDGPEKDLALGLGTFRQLVDRMTRNESRFR